jgi:hypothetical protein
MTVPESRSAIRERIFLSFTQQNACSVRCPVEFLTMLTPDKNLRSTDLGVGIGHVHLKISGMESSLAFSVAYLVSSLHTTGRPHQRLRSCATRGDVLVVSSL